MGVRFLDKVIDKNSFPTKDIEGVAKNSRPVGSGIMGMADYFLMREMAYGSPESIEEIQKIMQFMYDVAENESVKMGEELGVPEWCQRLPVPRRNITVLTVAPTGTVSLIAGCTSGCEPIFSEITIRNDKTGTYQFENDLASKPYFRCAVSANGAQEVNWQEHVKMQTSIQQVVDSGVSKTINFPNHTRRETIANAFIMAWELGAKGITVYRNGSRKVEVLSPKNLKKDKCPICGQDVVKYDGCTKCTSTECGWSMCDPH